MEGSKKEERPAVDLRGKTSAQIIDEEMESLRGLPADSVVVEHHPIKQVKIKLDYTINKQLDITLIYPGTNAKEGEEEEEELESKHQYPNSTLAVKLRSKVMPHKMVETLLKKAEALSKKLAVTRLEGDKAGDWTGQPQGVAVFEFLQGILETNNLIPAWEELPQIRGILRLPPKKGEERKEEEKKKELDEIKLFEKQGKIRVKAREAKFFLEFDMVVPEEYPAKQPQLKFIDHNLDQNFAHIFEAGANQIIRRLWQGGEPNYEPGAKKKEQGKEAVKKNQGALEYQMERLKILSKHELKHDVKYLNMAADLRQAATEGDKQAKKLMKLKMKHESSYEEKMQEEEEQILKAEQIAKGVELNVETARPSLFHVANFLTNHFVRFLPGAKCLECREKLVRNIKRENLKTDPMRPERSYCGHWMHFKCFEACVNRPPFLPKCPAEKCGENFGSPTFKIDEGSVKSREKVYMQTEQKRGEEDVLNQLLGI
mmetsp:Transcript_17822/g.30224  ORF Transcript_17822/g.30224 Transcript_17822/m.30224 type:complete len:486 (-) Transcript_17822:71-1528(-)